MYIQTFVYGKVPIEMWEYPVMILLLIAVFSIGTYIRNRRILIAPEYKYFVWGLLTKVLGGFLFACIYVFYYGQGDTTTYYECTLAFCKLLGHDVSDFFTVLVGDGTQEMKSYFTAETGEPLMSMFQENSTRFMMKILIPFMLVGGTSYFITTILVSVFTYGGLWSLFRMFVSYYPDHTKSLALAILFMPSVMFWGSGILKDSFTLAATCYLIVSINRIIQRKGNIYINILRIVLFTYVVLSIKAYVISILLPSTLVWMLYNKVSSIRNRLFRYMILPLVYIVVVFGSYFGLKAFGESMGKFSIDRALKTASINQFDLKQEHYGGNSFDIGDFEPTVGGALSKFPQATMAGLFRPYLWDSRNVVMILSALENTFVLVLTIMVFTRIKWRRIFRFLVNQPLLLYCLVFSILFAFMIGLTSPNYGALVRFRVPLIPLYMACLVILYQELKKPAAKRLVVEPMRS